MDQNEPSRPTLIDVMKEMIKSQKARATKTTMNIDDLASTDVNDEFKVQGVAVLSDN